MRALSRGEVIRVLRPDGKGGFKERHVIVHKNAKEDDQVISIYCTGENDGEDANNIFVEHQSDAGVLMKLTKDTYIRATTVIIIKAIFVVRPIGTCPFMKEIAEIQDKHMAK